MVLPLIMMVIQVLPRMVMVGGIMYGVANWPGSALATIIKGEIDAICNVLWVVDPPVPECKYFCLTAADVIASPITSAVVNYMPAAFSVFCASWIFRKTDLLSTMALIFWIIVKIDVAVFFAAWLLYEETDTTAEARPHLGNGQGLYWDTVKMRLKRLAKCDLALVYVAFHVQAVLGFDSWPFVTVAVLRIVWVLLRRDQDPHLNALWILVLGVFVAAAQEWFDCLLAVRILLNIVDMWPLSVRETLLGLVLIFTMFMVEDISERIKIRRERLSKLREMEDSISAWVSTLDMDLRKPQHH